MASTPALRRSMSFLDGAALIIGTVIGSGIFASPGKVLREVGSPGMALVVWFVAGILSLAGALCYAELGAAMPVSGGEFAYFRKTLGRPISFLFIWTQFFVMKTGSQAILSITFATYLGSVIFETERSALTTDWRTKAIALITIATLTAVNCIGVRWGSTVQIVFTGLKLLALAGIIVLGFTSFGRSPSFDDPFAGSTFSAGTFGIAMIACLWAYDGWNNLNYVTEELKDPERNLPRAILFGLVGIMAVYILTNVAYLAVLTPEQIVGSKAVAKDLAIAILGPIGGILIPLGVAASTFGATNGSLLSGSRAFYAAARDGQLPRPLAQLDPRTGVPVIALAAQGVWAAVLVIPGDFETLVDYFGFAAWVFYFMAAVALMILRKQAPELPRPYKVWPYPLVPLVFMAVAGFLVINALINSFIPSAAALGFILLGWPVYALVVKKE